MVNHGLNWICHRFYDPFSPIYNIQIFDLCLCVNDHPPQLLYLLLFFFGNVLMR